MSRASSLKPMPTLPAEPALAKRRRGRQPRPCALSPGLRDAARAFARAVGSPRVIEPAGFRDFVGWLQLLASPAAADAWGRLTGAALADAGGDSARAQALQPDVVREIIANVIVIRPGESSKLVSTNARRQSTRPEHGLTLMKIFDARLASAARGRVAAPKRVPSNLRREPPRPAGKPRVPPRAPPGRAAGPARRPLPQPLRLPSMQELDASLRRR